MNKNAFLSFFVLTLLFLGFSTFTLCAQEEIHNEEERRYTIQDMGTLSFFKSASCIDINDNGQALLQIIIDGKCNFAIWDPSFGFHLIDTSQAPLQSLHFSKISNDGDVIAFSYETIIKGVTTPAQIVTWSIKNGFQVFDFPEKMDCHGSLPNGHCDNYIIGNYSFKKGTERHSRIFILENEKARDFSMEELFLLQGYSACDYSAIAVNQKGNILGRFSHKVIHPFRGNSVTEQKYFSFCDGELYVIENPVSFEVEVHIEFFDIGNDGKALFHEMIEWPNFCSTISIWSPNEGFEKVQENISYGESSVLSDRGDISIGHELLLKTENEYQKIYVPYLKKMCSCDKYPEVRFQSIQKMNRSGQMVVSARFMGESHPFLLTPIN